ncbi:PAS domain S-box protein [Flavobacterium cyclinae]|uniref:PAS domain S-box protein n=1 Tax=Flavobacterium cyclinae TaxID=2895947 RepID=UPI001E4066BA|nr:PAS domain S-box protein [Flavobacterium cyclinae]UGS22215.1 PAS domain S-box protein [Flavobacterium cyclinae]
MPISSAKNFQDKFEITSISIDKLEKNISNVLNLVFNNESCFALSFQVQIEDKLLSIKKGDFDLNVNSQNYTNRLNEVKSLKVSQTYQERINDDFSNITIYPIVITNSELIGTLALIYDDQLSKEAMDTCLQLVESHIELFENTIQLKREVINQNKQLESFIENSKEILYELNHLGEILYLSDSWEAATGYTIEESLGKITAEYLHPDDIESVGEFLSKLVPNEKCNESVTYRIKHKKGHYIWHSSDVKLIERDNTLYFIGNCRDVMDFIKSQEEITKQKEFYGKILDRLPIDLGVWDENHRYLFLNREAIKNDELRNFIIGKDDFEYAKHTGRDDGFAKSRRGKFLKALENKEIVEWEDQINDLNGNQRFFIRKFIPIYNSDGQFEMMTGYGIDVTESKKINEEILKSRQLTTSVIQNAAVGIIVQGPQSEFLEYNKSACEMLGLTEDQMIGKSSFHPHWKVVHLDGSEFKAEEHPVPQVIKNLIPVKNVTMGVHRPLTNDLVWLLVDAIPVFNNKKELLYVICTFNDITARKKAEDALIESNERFKYASEATSDALWDWDIETNKIFVGESYNLLFGYQFDNNVIPGEFCESLVHPEDKEDYENSIENAFIENKQKWSHEYRYLKSDGTYAFVSDKAIIIRDENGNPVRMIGAMQNITQEKLLKYELQQSEERFKGAFNNSSFGSALVSLNGNWIVVNNRMTEILGYTKEEFKELSFVQFTHKDDLEIDLAYKKQMDEGEISYFHFEKRFIHKNQSLVWVHLSVSTVKDSNGNVQYYVAQVVDISERKRMEEENRLLVEENNRNKAQQLMEAKNWYRLLADNTIDLVCLHNLDSSFKYVSPSIKNLLGYTPEDLIGKYPADLIHPEDLEKFKSQIGTIINKNKRISEQVRLINSNGEYQWFETNATLVYENNVPVSYQSSTRDITQRKKAEKIIEDTLIQERQLNELRTNLVSTISHEFRTPMTTIRTSAELIAMYIENSNFEKTPQVEKRLETITKEIDRIVELMDAVLTISKDDADKTSFNPVICNLKEICLDVIETSFAHQKDNRSVEVFFESSIFTIYADANLIKYTLFNLLSNAFKYSVGFGNVKLNLKEKDENIIVEVIDNGIGIPEEDQPKLFNTFFRASNSNGIQGTGLGLYIIKTFTEKNSGSVMLESQLGKGTKVTLEFPLFKNE